MPQQCAEPPPRPPPTGAKQGHNPPTTPPPQPDSHGKPPKPHPPNPTHPRGSSPHTRGAPALFDPGSAWIRIIPAYAGSTITVPFRCCSGADHPRIRGEHDEVPDRDALAVGSSPHTRGARVEDGARLGGGRIIPAYAGSTPTWPSSSETTADHPRIRGEHLAWHRLGCAGDGSSPHTRGAPGLGGQPARRIRIIPAYAGSTLGNPCNTKDRRRDYTSFPLPVTHPSGGGGS